MNPGQVVLLVAAGFGAGVVNGVGGGGTLLSFSALLAVGLPALRANLTSTVGIFPGFIGGVAGFREEISDQTRRVAQLSLPAMAGSVAGAVLLLTTPAKSFQHIVPYLILLACALFTIQPVVARSVRQRAIVSPEAKGPGVPDEQRAAQTAASHTSDVSAGVVDGASRPSADTAPSRKRIALTGAGVFVGAIYGGYFGAGLGVVLLALLGMLLPDRLVRTNGLRTTVAFVVSVGAVAVFVIHGDIAWLDAALLAPSCVVGGYVGARLARRLPAAVVRIVVIALGLATAIRLLAG